MTRKKSIVKKMIEVQDRWWVQILVLPLSIILLKVLFGSWTSAIVFVFSMVVHELGHALLLFLNGVQPNIFLLFPLGAGVSPANEEEKKKSDLLPWYNVAWFLQAGLMANLLLAFLGMVMVRFFPGVSEIGRNLIFINVLLFTVNAVPVWKTDGGQLFLLIFSSLKEKQDLFLSSLLTIGILGILLGVLWKVGDPIIFLMRSVKNLDLVIVLAVSIIGVWRQGIKDNPVHSLSKQAMNKKQSVVQLTVFIIICFGIGCAYMQIR